MVGARGFEPLTFSMSRKRSNQLSYAPDELPVFGGTVQGVQEVRSQIATNAEQTLSSHLAPDTVRHGSSDARLPRPPSTNLGSSTLFIRHRATNLFGGGLDFLGYHHCF